MTLRKTTGAPADGHYWAKIKHTGEVEIVEVSCGRWRDGSPVISRIGDEQGMQLDQVEIIEAIAPPAACNEELKP